MKNYFNLKKLSAALAFALAGSMTVVAGHAYADQAAETAAKPDVLREEVSKPLAAAQQLFDAKNVQDALKKIAEADAVENKTPYEIFAIERTRGQYLATAGDKVNAAKAFEAAIASNYARKADQLTLIEVVGQLKFQASDYPGTIAAMTRYTKEGGTDPRASDVLNKAYYLNKNFAEAYNGFNAQTQAIIASGQKPEEQILQLQLNCKINLNDAPGITKSAELLTTYYPSAKNWNYLISEIHSRPGFSDKLYLDIYRLKLELGLMKTGADYADMAELANRAGLPAEAKKAYDLGFAAGVLDKGPEAKKYASMREAATKHADEDLKTMAQGEVSAGKSKDGTGLVNLGFAYATAGQYDKAIALIEEGIAKGGLARPDEARLHLGVVYYWAGKKDAALKQLSGVQTNDGSSDLARYWIMQINNPIQKS